MDILLTGLPNFKWSLEWGGGYSYAHGLQYPSMTTLLYWTPHHALPGWLGAALFLQLKDEPNFHKNAMLLGTCLCLWSAFSALGVALLFLAWFALNPRFVPAACMSPSALVRQAGGTMLALPPLLFIAANNFTATDPEFYAAFASARGAAFLLAEFALLGLAGLYLAGPRQRPLLAAVCILLALLPFYRFGGPNLMIRASIPVLFVFWCLLLQAFQNGRALSPLAARAVRGWIAAGILLGAATPLVEVFRAKDDGAGQPLGRKLSYSFSPPPVAEVSNFKFSGKSRYLGHQDSFFFRYLAPVEDGRQDGRQQGRE